MPCIGLIASWKCWASGYPEGGFSPTGIEFVFLFSSPFEFRMHCNMALCILYVETHLSLFLMANEETKACDVLLWPTYLSSWLQLVLHPGKRFAHDIVFLYVCVSVLFIKIWSGHPCAYGMLADCGSQWLSSSFPPPPSTWLEIQYGNMPFWVRVKKLTWWHKHTRVKVQVKFMSLLFEVWELNYSCTILHIL